MLLPSQIDPARLPMATALNHQSQRRGTLGQIVGSYVLVTILWPDGALELVNPQTVGASISLDVTGLRAALAGAGGLS